MILGGGPDGDDNDRRAALLLALLRLSRDPELLPRLEAALAGLGDGRRPSGAVRHADRRLLRRLGERLPETLGPEDAQAWDTERRAEGEEAAAAATAVRLGLAPPAGTPPRVAEAMRAAGELVARLDAGEEVEAGATTAAGWTVVGRTGLERVAAWLPSDLWALLAPGGAELVFVATGGGAPELWDWDRVGDALEYRRGMLGFTEAFVRVADAADPAKQAARAAAREALERAGVARHGTENRGPSVLHLLDGRPVRAERAFLLGAEGHGPGVEALRVDLGPPFVGPPPGRPWAEQVWARPLGGGEWRRGRLRPEADRVMFVDEPGAEEAGPPPGAAAGKRRKRSLEADLLASAWVKRKAAVGGAYARLLHAALADSVWRHSDGDIHEAGPRDAAGLVAQLAGAGTYTDWAWGGPVGVLDEEVLSDLGALGWRRIGV